ncbi:MAG: N-acetylmuramoyl-L-alanine amidase [Bdellovibrionales bacterium]
MLIDPGHGGHDHGAVKHNVREATLTLSISKKLKRKLDKDPNFLTTITRSKNKKITLRQRVVKAHKKSADVFLSIHANSSPSIRARGAEFYFQNTFTPDQYSLFIANRENGDEASQKGHRPSVFLENYNNDVGHILDDMARKNYINKSHEFAKIVQRQWKKEFKTKRARIKQAPFYVVSSTNMPALLVEVGYITNDRERKRLVTEAYQNRIVDSLYKALADLRSKMHINTAQKL